MTSRLERLDGLGKILVEENRLKDGDFLLIHSVSGRNNVPVEMAMEAEARGVQTAAITNVAYSSALRRAIRPAKRLFEVCGFVLDNKGAVGDAAVMLDGLPEKIGPTSTGLRRGACQRDCD